MTFDDLPESWSHLPLDDSTLQAGVVDLLVGERDRAGGCLAFLLLDAELRLSTPCLVGDVPRDGDPAEIAPGLDEIVQVAAAGRGAVLFARGRDGSGLLRDRDRAWHQAVLDACRRHDVRLVGAFLATPGMVRPFPRPLADADAAAVAS
ncbi:MAG: hypothetical protein ACRCSN_18410 [Dermatophilaceae bacterium]